MLESRIKKKPGFTLVELLVVIGIIALLIAILLPALNKARIQAKRTQDLSNIHQIAIACVAYAAENHGDWPLGDRGGPNLNLEPLYNDDISWINTFTFAYFLQFVINTQSAEQWLSTTAPYPNGKPLDEPTQRRFACTSIADAPYSAQSLINSNVGLGNVGLLTNRYYQTQTSPSGTGLNQTYMGFFYWGRRADSVQGPVYDQAGTALVPATTFTFPLKQGQRSFSQTLLSCPAYTNTGTGDSTEYTHCNSNDSLFQSASLTVAIPGDGRTGPSAAMQGICCAYVDGSARWVPRRQLWSVDEGGYAYVYFDKGN